MQENTEQLIEMPEDRAHLRLYSEIRAFADYMDRPRDWSEVQKDKMQSLPVAMLPMLF